MADWYTAEKSMAKFGTSKYAGWKEPEASNDFQATGGKGGSQERGGEGEGQTAQEYADAIISAQQQSIDRETKFLEQYTKDNPFIFDETLARESATAEYEPYYTELLDDYLNKMDIRRESLQADVDLLKELKQYDTASRTRAYQMAVSGAEEGYAGSGMFFSGIRRRGVGQRTVEYKAGQAEQEARYGGQFEGYERQKQLYDLEQKEKERDIEREQKAAIESGVLTRKKESLAQYYTPLEQSYYRQFPTGTGNTLKGYTIPEYYRY